MASSKGTILLTGANGGLGSAIAQQIAEQPEFAAYHGLYTVRDAETATATALASTLGRSLSHSHDILSLDLTRLDVIRETARTINERVASGEIAPIRTIILNACFQDFGKQAWTEGGLDKTFSANYLGHWLLTLLLLQSMDRAAGRIIVLGSQSHDPFDERNDAARAFTDEKSKNFVHDQASFEAIAKGTYSSAKEDPSWRGGFRRYGATKLFVVMMIHELQRRMDQDPALSNVCILGVDPGSMSTGLRDAPWFIRVLIVLVLWPILTMLLPNGQVRTTRKSASHVLQAAFNSGPGPGQFPRGVYLDDGTEPRETSVESRDARKRDVVWKGTVHYAQLKEGETILVNWR